MTVEQMKGGGKEGGGGLYILVVVGTQSVLVIHESLVGKWKKFT